MLDSGYMRVTDYQANRSPDGWPFLGVAESCAPLPDGKGASFCFDGPVISGSPKIYQFAHDQFLNIYRFHSLTETVFPLIYDMEDSFKLEFRFSGEAESIIGKTTRIRRKAGYVYAISIENGVKSQALTQKNVSVSQLTLIFSRKRLSQMLDININAVEKMLHRVRANNLLGNDALFAEFPMTPAMQRIGAQIVASKFTGDLHWLYCKAKTMELLCEFIHTINSTQTVIETDSRTLRRHMERLHLARDLLDTDYQDAPTIAELARSVGMSKTNLVCGFRKAFDVSIAEYVRSKRMQAAESLLLNEGLTITQIAYQIGFQNASSFITAFKAYYGQTPGQYIKN